jgi:glutamate synthase (NADPH/NADH) small chain
MRPKPSPNEVDRKKRLAAPEGEIRKQDPAERCGNFDEVYLPFDEEDAKAAAARCIQCPKAVCIKACPLHNDIPLALWQLEHGDFESAARVFRLTSNFSEICGRVCPQIVLCEGACIYKKKGKSPVPVGRLEAFVADYLKTHGGWSVEQEPPTGHRAAVVGAGPAGLTVAELLARRGHQIAVYDLWPAGGGVMRYGIPKFKMDHQLVNDKVAHLEQLGVQFQFNTKIGTGITVDDLIAQGYETVFLGIGAGVTAEFKAPGVNLLGVYDATPFLIRANVEDDLKPEHLKGLPRVGENVVIIGGGDTAMDCARTAVRLGAQEVTVVYRRTEAQMPGNAKDRTLAAEEGVEFKWLTQPLGFVGDDAARLVSMECQVMELGEPDDSGRQRPVPLEGSEFTIPVDTVVLALGYWPDPLVGETTPGLETHDWGLVNIDEETGRTSRDAVFAGGDDVRGPDLVVTAVAQARIAAEAMHQHMMRNSAEQPETSDAADSG